MLAPKTELDTTIKTDAHSSLAREATRKTHFIFHTSFLKIRYGIEVYFVH